MQVLHTGAVIQCLTQVLNLAWRKTDSTHPSFFSISQPSLLSALQVGNQAINSSNYGLFFPLADIVSCSSCAAVNMLRKMMQICKHCGSRTLIYTAGAADRKHLTGTNDQRTLGYFWNTEMIQVDMGTLRCMKTECSLYKATYLLLIATYFMHSSYCIQQRVPYIHVATYLLHIAVYLLATYLVYIVTFEAVQYKYNTCMC